MISTELLDVQPNELQFTFEVKKQSTCSIQLGNKSDHCVAFKVKTTSPKKYCVRPNAGIIKPKATCDITVTMQAQKVAPPELQCKDKFLIQCTIVPFGISEEEVTSNMFAKASGKYVEEKKLRVVLTSPSPSPEFLITNKEPKEDICYETSPQKDRFLNEVESIPPPPQWVADNVNDDSQKGESRTVQHTDQLKPETNAVMLDLEKELEELKSKILAVNLKLKEADLTIVKLTEEKSTTSRETTMLKHELELLRKSRNIARSIILVGFPLVYIFMVALISVAIGYFAHP